MLRILDVFYFAIFYVGTSCLVLFISLSASFFSRGLRPHLHAFCKKAWQKLLCFLLSVFFISLRVSNPQNKMLVCKCFAFLTYFILLFFMSALRALFFLFRLVLRFSLVGSAHTCTLFVKKRGKNFCVFCSPCSLFLFV